VFEAGCQIRLIDSAKGSDDLLLRRVCHRHLVSRRHASVLRVYLCGEKD
jgi:hypothetical protein